MVTGTVAARAPGATAKDVPFAQTRGHLNSEERAGLPAPSSRRVLAGTVAQRMGRAATRHTSSNHAEKSHRVPLGTTTGMAHIAPQGLLMAMQKHDASCQEQTPAVPTHFCDHLD